MFFVKEVVNLNSELPLTATESGRKKKKKSNKVEDQKDPITKPLQTKPKKVLEKQDSKSSDKPDKVKPSPKPSREPSVKPTSPTPATPPPVVKKQEAKVKGVPKETGDLKRQQSLPTYDKPPRLQTRAELTGFPASPQQLDGFPTVPRADPPRAIIYPELKRELPVNQFGAIGCKVPVNNAPNGGWADPAVSSQMGLSPVMSPPSPGLIPPPGVSIMQQLQAERRYREEEFRRTQWPGFGTDTRRDYLESLWDSPNSAPKPPTTPQGMWGTLGQNVWPSTVLQGAIYICK